MRRRNRRGNFEHGGIPKGKKGGMGIIIMVGRKSSKNQNKMKIQSKYMYGGKSTYRQGGVLKYTKRK